MPIVFLLGVLVAVIAATWRVLREGSPYLLAGLALAGLLHEFVDTRRIGAAMGRKGWRSILAGTLLGAPLPLCSCGVIPAAVSLRRKGASREASLAFLVSTPETGIDSLALTWGLLGPLFALVRAGVGILMGILVGAVTLLRGGADPSESPERGPALPEDAHDHSEGLGDPLLVRLRRAAQYGFVELFGDLAFWLALGFLASGILTALLPEQFFVRFLSNEILSFLVMGLAGTLTYVCASASTPVAAAMIGAGLSPGAALVFLLAGAATNPTTLLVVGRLFGRRLVALYLGTVFAASVAAGLLVNRILTASQVVLAPPSPAGLPWIFLEVLSAMALLFLTAVVLHRRGLRRDWKELIDPLRAALLSLAGLPWRRIARAAAWSGAGLLAAGWLSTSLFRVRPGERAIVRFLGKIDPEQAGPGLHLAAPVPFGGVEIVAANAVRTAEIGFLSPPIQSVSEQAGRAPVFPRASPSFTRETARIPFESQFVTGDENVIEVTAVVQYRIRDAALFRVSSERAEASVGSFARAILVEEIGKLPVDAVYSSARGQIEVGVLRRLREDLDGAKTGLETLGVRLLYVHAPDDVHQAFRDVASAAEDSATSRNTALVETEGSVRQARAEAARSVLEADAARVEAVERARGAVAAFVQIRREYERAPDATRLRLYLETAERALAPLNKWIKPAGIRSLELWISRSAAPGVSSPLIDRYGLPESLIPELPRLPQK